jgi:hypothetical protein
MCPGNEHAAHGRRKRKVLQFERMMLFTGDYHNTIWLNASYPTMLKKILYPALKQSLLSVLFNETKE